MSPAQSKESASISNLGRYAFRRITRPGRGFLSFEGPTSSPTRCPDTDGLRSRVRLYRPPRGQVGLLRLLISHLTLLDFVTVAIPRRRLRLRDTLALVPQRVSPHLQGPVQDVAVLERQLVQERQDRERVFEFTERPGTVRPKLSVVLSPEVRDPNFLVITLEKLGHFATG